MSTNMITINQGGQAIALPPSTIGFNTRDGRVIGLREAASIPFSTLAKATWAAAIGRSVVRTRQLMGEQAADKALAVTLKRQRDEAVERAAYLHELLHTTARPPVLLIEAAPPIEAPAETKASRKVQRWSSGECTRLVELRVSGMAYGKIADALGTGRSAAACGAKARALAAKADRLGINAKTPARAPRKARRAAP